MTIYQVMATAILDIDEDRIEILEGDQIMGMQARMTYEQAVAVARSRVPDWKQFLGRLFGRDFRAEAEAQVSRHHFGILDVGINLMLDVEGIDTLRALVRRVNGNGVRSYRDVDVRWVEIR